jgi:RNA polymerase primary sigma factor
MSSCLDTYLAEIDRTPLLTPAAERELAYRIAAGDAAARDRLVRANLRLVVRIARDYRGKGLSLEDLVAEGNLGLVRAAEGFDPAAGCRFATYASYWVKQSIRSALNKTGHAVRLPHYASTLLGQWRRAEAELRDELSRPPEREEVAGRLGLTPKQARVVARAEKAVASGRTGGAEADLGEFVAGEWTAPDAPLADADDRRAALAAVERLGAREATILRLRFGLGGDEPATLQQVGDTLGLTRERVRQIERDALAALRGRLVA